VKVAPAVAILYFLAVPGDEIGGFSATARGPQRADRGMAHSSRIEWPSWANPDDYTLWDSASINVSESIHAAPEYPDFYNPWGKAWLVRRLDGDWEVVDDRPTAGPLRPR
jgi:hypothetical protein